MLQDKPTWIKLVIVCMICLVIISLLGLLIQQFT